jgi:2-dehydro-3-deoxyphosphooctonate aldolase (KDO 8-P synthase)
MIRNTQPMHIREGIVLGSDKPVLFSGPCAVESYDICIEIGTKVKAWADEHGFSYVFKASFDKANRTSSGSFRSIGRYPKFDQQEMKMSVSLSVGFLWGITIWS